MALRDADEHIADHVDTLLGITKETR